MATRRNGFSHAPGKRGNLAVACKRAQDRGIRSGHPPPRSHLLKEGHLLTVPSRRGWGSERARNRRSSSSFGSAWLLSGAAAPARATCHPLPSPRHLSPDARTAGEVRLFFLLLNDPAERMAEAGVTRHTLLRWTLAASARLGSFSGGVGALSLPGPGRGPDGL